MIQVTSFSSTFQGSPWETSRPAGKGHGTNLRQPGQGVQKLPSGDGVVVHRERRRVIGDVASGQLHFPAHVQIRALRLQRHGRGIVGEVPGEGHLLQVGEILQHLPVLFSERREGQLLGPGVLGSGAQEAEDRGESLGNQIKTGIARSGVEIGTELLGGKKSSAYHDKTLRAKVFRDIHTEIKRQFGLYDATGKPLRYVYLQRKNKDRALSMVAGYELPAALYEDVEAANTAD